MLDMMTLLASILGPRAAASARNLTVHAGPERNRGTTGQWVLQASVATSADVAAVLRAVRMPQCTTRNRVLYEVYAPRATDRHFGDGDDTTDADPRPPPADGGLRHPSPARGEWGSDGNDDDAVGRGMIGAGAAAAGTAAAAEAAEAA